MNAGSELASLEPAPRPEIAERRWPKLWLNAANRLLASLFSDRTLTHKAYLNAVAQAIDYATRLVVGFVVNPILVAGLGDYGYGAWQVLGRLIGYVSPASGRPGQALRYTLAYLKSSDDADEKRRQIGSSVIVWLYFVPVLGVLGVVLTWFAPSWLHSPPELIRHVRIAAALLAANLIALNLAGLPKATLQGENLGYKRIGLSTILVLAGGVFIVLAVRFRTGLGGVAAANLATTLLTGALFLKIVRQYVPWFGIAWPSSQEVRRFLSLSWWFLTWRSVIQLMIASDVVLLGVVSSVKSVTAYTLTKYAPEMLISWITMVVWGMTPGLGEIVGAGDLKKAAGVRAQVMSFTWLIATSLGATILLWNPSFISLWVGGKYDIGLLNTFLILLMAIQLALIRSEASIIDVTLDLRSKVMIGAVAAAVSVALAAVLVLRFKLGITGLCAGFIVGRLILNVAYPVQIGQSWGVPFLSQLKSTLRPAATTVLLLGMAFALARNVHVRSWPGLSLSVASTGLITFAVALFAGLPKSMRAVLMKRVLTIARSAS